MKRREAKTLITASKAEIERAMHGIAAPGHPKPYLISHLIKDVKVHKVWARYGAIWQENTLNKRNCFADVRVGSYKYDQVTSGGLDDNDDDTESFDMIDLPVESEPDALRFSLWRLTDAKYREAVVDYYSRKSRDLSYVDQNKKIHSFCKVKPEETLMPLKELEFDKVSLQKLVRKLSLVFKPYQEIKNSYVELKTSLRTKLYVSSEGVVRVWQEPLVELVAHFWFLGAKNEDQSFTVTAMAPTVESLPSKEKFTKDIKNQIEAAYKLEKSHTLNSYAGPVLLSSRAAGLFLHEAVGHRLESSRFLADEEGRSLCDKVGQKIMHKDLSIWDDPSLKEWNGTSLVGHYPFDDEGVPSKRAHLVENGVLNGFLTTRSPFPPPKKSKLTAKKASQRNNTHQSNGHSRQQYFERPISRMANLVVESSSQESWRDLKEKLCKEVVARKLPYGVILYDVEGGETGTDAYDFQAFLGEITVAALVFPDGREELVKGVDFVGTPLSCLNQILAVGRDVQVDNGYCGAESGMIPVSTVAPPLLLSNLELQSKSPTKVTQYRLPLPWFTKQ